MLYRRKSHYPDNKAGLLRLTGERTSYTCEEIMRELWCNRRTVYNLSVRHNWRRYGRGSGTLYSRMDVNSYLQKRKLKKKVHRPLDTWPSSPKNTPNESYPQ